MHNCTVEEPRISLSRTIRNLKWQKRGYVPLEAMVVGERRKETRREEKETT
jgi:hypothetical protein